MARLARVVVPGVPHHITQRGNRRLDVFFEDADYEAYIELMRESCRRWGVQIWGYCLMTNHVHLIAVPKTADALAPAIGEAHRRYTRHVNFRQGWRGYLFQGRFASYPMDENYLLAAARYVEMNPVAAGMVKRPSDHPWSSARAHLAGADDRLCKVKPMLKRVEDWAAFLRVEQDEAAVAALERHGRTGRPLGDERFVKKLERRLDRELRPRKPGPKPKE